MTSQRCGIFGVWRLGAEPNAEGADSEVNGGMKSEGRETHERDAPHTEVLIRKYPSNKPLCLTKGFVCALVLTLRASSLTHTHTELGKRSEEARVLHHDKNVTLA